jgi:phage gpG-like protein
MSTLKIEINSNVKQIAAAVGGCDRAMAEAVARAMGIENDLTVGHITKNKLRQRGPTTLGVVSRTLSRSIRATKPVISGSGVSSSIGTNVKYAGAHEYGSKPHIIRPRKAKALRFSGPNGLVFAKFVNHPGTPARRPIGSGIEERAENYSTSISRAIEEAWKK